MSYVGNKPAQTTIPADDAVTTAMLKDDAVTSAKIAGTTIVNADINASAGIANSKMATDTTNATNLASGTVPTARLGSGSASSSTFLRGDQTYAAVDTTGIVANQDDIALLGFKVAANGSLARFDLVDQSIDAFETEDGVDLSTSTGEFYSAAGNFYSGAEAAGWITEDRNSGSNLLTVSSDMAWFVDGSNPLDIQSLVNGVTSYDALGGNWFDASQDGYIRFDHGSGNDRVYTDSRWTYRTGTTEGLYKWQGSADAISWTDIGSTFTLSADADYSQNTDTHGQMTSNTTAYRYYQCIYVSGNQTNGGGRRMEMDFYGAAIAGDMVLVSNAQTAQSAPTTGDLVITYTDGVGTATVNTDIKAYISRNGSAYTSAVTLASQGTTGGHTILTANGVDLSGITTGTSMRWKIETLNQSGSKETRIHAVSLGWS